MKAKEKKSIIKFINKWSNRLNGDSKKKWDMWIKIRDEVAKEMELNEEQILYLTKSELAKYVCNDYKEMINYDDSKAAEILENMFFDKVYLRIGFMTSVYHKYSKKCEDILKEFNSKINNCGIQR